MLFDTSSWVEFFQGTEKSETVKNILEKEENFTSIVTLAEITNWCVKNKQEAKIKDYVNGIKKGSAITDLNEEISILAGKLNYERKKIENNWGMLDSFILATAQIYNLKILTKDKHFKDLPNVEML